VSDKYHGLGKIHMNEFFEEMI